MNDTLRSLWTIIAWVLVVVAFCGTLGAVAASEPGSKRPNVVLIVADDLGRQLGCYGEKTVRTPHLDALAAQGIRFNSAYCTTASCSPSRSVILTGLYNHANGQYGLEHAEHHFRSRENLRSLPVLLADAGYRTAAVGKIHVGPKPVYQFHEHFDDRTQGSRNTVRMAENVRGLLTASDDRPFFLYFCPTDPHRSGGNGQFANGPEGKSPHPGMTPVRYDPAQIALPPWLPDQPEVRREWAEYAQSISRLDQGVGKLMALLRETGQAANTLVFFLSDNGPPFPGAKTTLYEPGVHLPLIVVDPRREAKNAATDALVTWVDLAPTILDYAGIDATPLKLHGRSLRTVLDAAGRGPTPAGWDEIYLSHTFHEVTMYYPVRCVRQGKYKYLMNLAHPLEFPFASDIYNSLTWQGVLKRKDTLLGKRRVEAFLHRPRHELYDLAADPHELNNLANQPEHEATLAKLQTRLKDWQQRSGDPWRIKYVHE